jgi:hypothetical protein
VVIYLNASLDHLWQRTKHDSRRPLLQAQNPRAVLKALLDTRDPLYRQTADLVVETGRQSVGKLVREIGDELSRRQLWPPIPAAPAITPSATGTRPGPAAIDALPSDKSR